VNTAKASDAAIAASDALAAVLRSVRLAPDPVAVWLVCADGPDRLSTHRDILAAHLPGCVHELPVSGYLELALAGATDVCLVTGPCCADAGEPAELADAKALLAARGHPTALSGDAPVRRRGPHRARPVPAAATLPLPRRALLAPMALTRLPYRPHTERERLLDALKALGAPTHHPVPASASGAPAARRAPDEPAGTDPVDVDTAVVAVTGEAHLSSAPPAGAVFAATGCTACAVCVKACPAGALAIGGQPPSLTLIQDVSRCTDCGECVRLCPEEGLARLRPLTWQDLQERTMRPIASVETVACARCGQATAVTRVDHGLCSVCAYRRKSPFGSTRPPNLAHR
jgi:ferredoxin